MKGKCIGVGVFCAAGAIGGHAQAAGFALIEQNASGIGNAYAGAAAVAGDASTIWFNPAGLTQLPGHDVTVAVHAINPSVKFTNSGSTTPTLPASITTGGGNGGDAGDLAVVPNIYASFALGESWRLGVGLNVPFGLLTEYTNDFIGRFQGLKSEIKTVNVNPTVAYRISPMISVGAGLNYQKIEAELTNRRVLGVNTEGLSRLQADDTQIGYNFGALFNLGEDMRLGLSYRSGMDYEVQGDALVTSPSGATVAAFPIHADVSVPAIASLSVVQSYGPEWDLLGDLSWTEWSTIQSINIINSNTGATAQTLELKLQDSWRLSLGVNYRPSEQWVIRGGLAYDQSSVRDEYRTVRLPDTDRYWLALGASFAASKAMSFDVGYVHIFGASAPIDQSLGNAAANGRVLGEYDLSVDIFSLQARFAF